MAKFAPPTEFDFNRPADWPMWRRRFERYGEIAKLDKETPAIQVSTLLYVMGNQAETIFSSLPLTAENRTKMTHVLNAFDAHFLPRRNIIHERAIFYTRKQKDGEPVEKYIRELYSLAENCDFQDKDDQLRDRLVVGMRDQAVSRDLQIRDNLTLEQAVLAARRAEAVSQQMGVQRETVSVEETSRKSGRRLPWKKKSNQPSQQNQMKKKCKFCAKVHVFDRTICPANKAECRKCHKVGHYAVCCTAVVQEVQEFSIEEISGEDEPPWMVKLKLNNSSKPILFKIDTGADVCVVTTATYQELKRPVLKHCGKTLQSVGGTLHCWGYFESKITRKNSKYAMKMYVVDGAKNNLLSRRASVAMDLIQVTLDEATEVSSGVYGDIGLMKIKPVKIRLVEDAVPYCVNAPRRIAIPLADRVKSELHRMEECGVISRVTEATEWCAPIVPVVKANGQIRICVDLKRLNMCVLRERYILPTMDDLVPQLQGAQVFSRLDAASGFWAVPLDADSQKLTTFITPHGRYCFRRLPFGITSAPEIFQRLMNDLLRELPGVVLYMDDILVFGSNKAEHDQRLNRVMTAIENSGLKLNRKKCEFTVSKLEFLGHTVSAEGIKPSENKVKAIVDLPEPRNVGELRHALGMMNYLGKYCSKLSETLKPLHDLLCKDNLYVWTENQSSAFRQAKMLVASAPVLAFFDPKKETIISADASSYGLGGVIMQKQECGTVKPIAFASRTLTKTEQLYAQIEKECLALTWACEKFAQFVTGLPSFELQTDHKPLVPLINVKDLNEVPFRCQRLLIRLKRFSPIVKYIPGKDLVIADGLSRLPLTHQTKHEEDAQEVEAYVDSVMCNRISPARMDEIKIATSNDKDLSDVLNFSLTGWPDLKDVPSHLRKYYELRQRLTVTGRVLMYDNRVVIPEQMKKLVLSRIHDGHQGITKCRERARTSVFWIGINKDIQEMVEKCEHCASNRNAHHKEPLLPTPLPSRPWERIAADLCSFEQNTYLVIVDYFSRFIEVCWLPGEKSEYVVNELKNVFARFGIPSIVVSDNGPCFSSQFFKDFANEWDFESITSSPLYPQSNGEAENAVRIAKTMLKQQDLQLALLTHRATPIPALGYSPAQLLMGRHIRSTLPMPQETLKPKWPEDSLVRERDERMKLNSKKNFDSKHAVRSLSHLDEGQRVVVADGHSNRRMATVIGDHHAPRSVMVETESGAVIRRNRASCTLYQIHSSRLLIRSSRLLIRSSRLIVCLRPDQVES